MRSSFNADVCELKFADAIVFPGGDDGHERVFGTIISEMEGPDIDEGADADS